uniref:Uncharacterized protein n=1 Tax=Paraburkholderia sprentiae WSM5005 TaxID=754502 RepID=A0A1I9YUT8_9BURK
MTIGKVEIEENDVQEFAERMIQTLRQRTRVQQLDVRKDLSQQKRQSGSEQFVIVDDQYAHSIVSQNRFRSGRQ